MVSVVGGQSIFNAHQAKAAVHPGNDAQHSPLGLASVTFSGTPAHGTGALHTQSHGGNTIVHLHDGSTITVLGTSHISVSFLHH